MLRRKAPTLAIEAFGELRRQCGPHDHGGRRGPMLPEVRAAVDRLGLAGDVELLGQVPWDQVRDLYASASVFLFTSLRESFGGQFLEALGKGLPAVALDLHGIADAEVGAAAIKVPLPDRRPSCPDASPRPCRPCSPTTSGSTAAQLRSSGRPSRSGPPGQPPSPRSTAKSPDSSANHQTAAPRPRAGREKAEGQCESPSTC